MEESKDIYSQKIKAGKRFYYIDIKYNNSYYIQLTESVKGVSQEDKQNNFKKFRIMIYPEDFNKIEKALSKTIKHFKENIMPNFDYDKFSHEEKIE